MADRGRCRPGLHASGLPHGIHGIHVHSVGRCDGPKFDSAGPHWNPASRKHGLSNPAGPHAGDLPNVTVAANGVLSTIVTVPGANLGGPDSPTPTARRWSSTPPPTIM